MSNKKTTSTTVMAVKVDNISMSKDNFDLLCDKLCLRQYSHDYRIVSDYVGPGYWQSLSCLPGDRVWNVNDVYLSVKEDVEKFLKKNKMSSDSIRIRVIELDGGKI